MIYRTICALFAAMAIGILPAGAKADPVNIRIGTHASIAVHIIMQKKPELMKNLGKTYNVEWIRFAGGGDAMPALVAGKLDGCLATPYPTSTALLQSQVPVTIVSQLLSLGFDGHYDDATVVRSDSGVTRFADLKGKVIGVNAIGSTADIGNRIMARKSGLNPETDLTIVEARPPFLAGMVRDKKVDAATLFQPFFQDAMSKGGLKALYSTSDIYGGPTDYIFMVFDDKFLKANGAAVKDYLADYLAAVNWALDHRTEAVAIYADALKLPVATVDSYLFTKDDYLVRRDGTVSAKAIQPIFDALAANGFSARRIDVSKMIDMSYLPK